jgi:5-methylcytosine-specific restriction endonuclease McrA
MANDPRLDSDLLAILEMTARDTSLAKVKATCRYFLNRRGHTAEEPAKRKPVPKEWRVKQYALQSGRCAVCREPFMLMALQVDHIHPIADGGKDEPRNWQLVCGPRGNGCNQRKSANDPVKESKRTGKTILEQVEDSKRT